MMVLVTREHVTIQLPAVKHLGWCNLNSDDDLSLLPDHYESAVAVDVHVEYLQLHHHVGDGDEVEAAGLLSPVAGVGPHALLLAGHGHAVLQPPLGLAWPRHTSLLPDIVMEDGGASEMRME